VNDLATILMKKLFIKLEFFLRNSIPAGAAVSGRKETPAFNPLSPY